MSRAAGRRCPGSGGWFASQAPSSANSANLVESRGRDTRTHRVPTSLGRSAVPVQSKVNGRAGLARAIGDRARGRSHDERALHLQVFIAVEGVRTRGDRWDVVGDAVAVEDAFTHEVGSR